MFCHNCGNLLSLETRHCVHCGVPRYGNVSEIPQSGPIQPVPFDSDFQSDEPLFKVRPAFFKIAMSYSFAAFLTAAATVLIAYFGGSVLWVWATAATLFFIPWIQHLRRNQISYTLRPDKIEIEQGILSKTTQNLALRHINNVAVYQSLTERLIGIGDVLIDSAGTADRIALKSIRNPRQHANLILTQLQRWK
jgi:uncharacterized membrane protein YdbT with pleckstrin-like domain